VSSHTPKRPLLLLDRDGTLNVEVDFLSNPEDLEILPGAVQLINRARELGWGVAVITNQSGLARGYFTEVELERVHFRLHEILGEMGVSIDAVFYCPHGPHDGCDCRKPKPGLVFEAAEALNGDLKRSIMIGDKAADIGAGKAAGTHTILVRTGYGVETERTGDHNADCVVDDLRGALTVMEAWSARDKEA